MQKVYNYDKPSYYTIKSILKSVGIENYRHGSQLERPIVMGMKGSILDYGHIKFTYGDRYKAKETLKKYGYFVEYNEYLDSFRVTKEI